MLSDIPYVIFKAYGELTSPSETYRVSQYTTVTLPREKHHMYRHSSPNVKA